MRKYIAILSLVVVSIFYSCSEEGIKPYGGRNYVAFSKEIKDTTLFSFFFFANAPEVTYPIEVKLVGKFLEKDSKFNIVVDEARTTLSNSLYTIPESFTFRAGLLKDTVYITLKNNADLIENQYRLQLNITDGSELLSANGPFGTAVLMVSNKAEKPSWWTYVVGLDGSYNPISVEGQYLGAYTRKKYEMYIKVTGRTDLGENYTEYRIYSLKFKHWLDVQDPKVLDEDGRVMTVPVAG